MDVIRIDLWYVTKKGLRDVVHIKVKEATTTRMKLEVTKALKPLLRRIEYYYVVVVVRKADGGKAYRTVVPKTVVA